MSWDEVLDLEWAAEWELHAASWRRDLTWIEPASEDEEVNDGQGRP